LYKRKDDEIVSVIQYSVTLASNSSLLNRDSTSPPQSDQLRNFSMIHAANPAGESFSAYAGVCGSLRCKCA
jgi:hypothetical protein